jgi:5-formyltetrahydrofolate cyclo-ligase
VTLFFYPRIVDSTLKFFRPLANEAFDEHEYGMLEPIPAQSEAWDPRRPSVVFCPAVAVDGSGRRLGLGKGFYDRFFSEHPEATRVGVVYQVQISSDPLPADSWDQTLDWVITDKMILRTAKRSA